jgi:hypothetical protein
MIRKVRYRELYDEMKDEDYSLEMIHMITIKENIG